jgi:hypothetical protein
MSRWQSAIQDKTTQESALHSSYCVFLCVKDCIQDRTLGDGSTAWVPNYNWAVLLLAGRQPAAISTVVLLVCSSHCVTSCSPVLLVPVIWLPFGGGLNGLQPCGTKACQVCCDAKCKVPEVVVLNCRMWNVTIIIASSSIMTQTRKGIATVNKGK